MTELRGIALRGQWKPTELAALKKILSPIPAAWLERNPHLRVLERQSVLTDAPPDAPGHSKYEPSLGSIVVYDKGVYHGGEIDHEQFRRSVYHELAHTILKCYPGLLKRWSSQTKGDAFVDDYAKTAPDEDFADTFSEFFIFPGKIRGVVPKKTAFMRELLAEAGGHREKVAMSFLSAFADELTKTAAGPSGALLSKVIKAVGSPTGMRIGKGAVIGGGGAAAGLAVGTKSGRRKGHEAGTRHMDAGMRQAYTIGVRRGAMAMRQAIVQQMRGQQQR